MRRPRIPDELAERIDGARGDVPFERWVRRVLEKALTGGVQAPNDEKVADPAPLTVSSPGSAAPSRAPYAEVLPRSKPFVCPVLRCPWPGAESEDGGPCPIHRRNLIRRRS